MTDEIINESPINGLPQFPMNSLPSNMPLYQHRAEKRPPPGAPHAGVYILRRLDKELFKVGCSINLKARIRVIQLSIKAFTTLEHQILFRRPRLLEAAIHRWFAEKCVEGEWYQLNAADLEFLKSIDPEKFIEYVYTPPLKGRAPTSEGLARAARNIEVQALRDSGLTLQQIADQYGLTRERVRQILKSMKGRPE